MTLPPDPRKAPPTAGARQVLAAARPARFPVAGPKRVVAVERLREAIADDVLAQLDALVLAGWIDPADDDTISVIAATWHAAVAEGVGRALDRLRAAAGTCRICQAQVVDGKCFGCDASPGRGL